jgi:ATP-dependent DNA helicase RecG
LVTPDGMATAAAILLVGKEPRYWLPGAYVQFLRLDGTSLTDPIVDQEELGGTLVDQLRRLDEILKLNVKTALDLSSGREVRFPDYPLGALQELARNALIHRNYENSTTPVRLTWYSDRIEITSPGGLFGEVTEANFGKPGATSYRNPEVAGAAKLLHFTQRFGIGIARARDGLAKNGNPEPTVVIEPTFVTWIIGARR